MSTYRDYIMQKFVLNEQNNKLIMKSLDEIIKSINNINKYDINKYDKIIESIQCYLDEYDMIFEKNIFEELCIRLYEKIKSLKMLNDMNKLSNLFIKYDINL